MKVFFVRVSIFLISTFFVLEVFFRIGLPARQYPLSTMDSETRIRNYQSSREGIFSYGALCRGKFSWRINPQGWNSRFDYFSRLERSNPMVALIGDSYLEGFWSDLDEHIDVKLSELSGGSVDFYSFGTWGAMLSQYLVIAKDVIAKYQPAVIVIFLNEDDARGSIYTESSAFLFCHTVEMVAEDEFIMVPPAELFTSRLVPILLHSASLRYLKTNRNLAFLARGAVVDPNANVAEIESFPAGSDTDTNINDFDEVTVAVTSYLLDQFESLDAKVVFVADSPRAPIYSGEESPGSYRDCALIEYLCRDRDDLIFIDLKPYFIEDWNEFQRMFSSEENPHWDDYGNTVVSNAIYMDIVNAI